MASQTRRFNLGKVLLGLFVSILVIAIIALSAAFMYYKNGIKAVGGSEAPITFVVDEGAVFSNIGEQLHEADLIRNAKVFDIYVRLNSPSDLKAGTYKLNKTMSVEQILQVLTEGKVATDLVTILPGKRVDQVEAELVRAGFDEAAVKLAMEPSVYGSHPVFSGMNLPESLEGFIYPESFVISAGTSPEEVIRLALDETNKILTPEVRAGINAQGLTIYQGLILASIIEKEAGQDPADKPTIAQVFLSRLKIDMQLGSDVTSIYGAVIDDIDLPENYAEAASVAIAHDSVYNTRMHAGLPPGPISNFTASSLTAIARPSETNYLYFVAGDDGKTHFSRTFEEHDAAASKYCIELCGR